MPQLIIRGARIAGSSFKEGTGGGVEFKILIEADWSEPVAEHLKWTQKPEGFGRGALLTKLVGKNFIMEPNSASLKDYRFDMQAGLIDQFKHIPVVKDGGVVDHKLSFIIHTTADDAHLPLYNWAKFVGASDSKAQCRLNYSDMEKDQMKLGEDGKQPTIPGAEAEPEKPRGRKKAAGAEIQ